MSVRARGFAAFVLVAPSAALAGSDVPPPDLARATSTEGLLEPHVATFLRPRPVARHASHGGAHAGIDALFLSANDDPEGDMPRALAWTPDGGAILIANRDTDNLTFVDPDALAVTDTLPVGDFPVDVDVTPDGQYALVPNVFANSVSVIDVPARTPVAEIPITGDQPYAVEIAADGSFAVVGVINDAVNSSFSVIDLATLQEIDTFPSVPQGVIGGFFSPESGVSGNIFTQFALASDGVTLVVPDRGNAQVALYDVTTGAELALLPTAIGPTAVDVSDDGTTAVVSHEGSERTITEIDLVARAVAGTVPTPDDLWNQIVRITPDGQHAVAALLNDTVFVDLDTGAATSINTGTVGDIVFTPDDQYAFVSNTNASVIDLDTLDRVDTVTFAPGANAAASPVENRVAVLNNRFREDVQVYTVDGSNSFAEGRTFSGSVPEGDATRTVAVTPDASRALAVNNTSDNATLFDLVTGDALAYIPTGERSLDVEITPDGSHAVVVNAEANTLSVIDLATNTNVANVGVSLRPGEVEVSPDGEWAYVATVAGTDRIWFVDLEGADSELVGGINAGQLGSIGYTYGVISGLALSPDGATLAVCVSFDDEVLLIDTASQTEITRVPVGDFPIRAAFTPDGSKLLVTNSFSDDLHEIVVDGANSHVESVVPGIEFPLEVAVDDQGFAYVASFDFNNPRVVVVDTDQDAAVGSVDLTGSPRSMHLEGSTLHVTTTDATIVRIEADGEFSFLLDAIPLAAGPSDLAFALGRAVVAQPIPDGVDLVVYASHLPADLTDVDVVFGTHLAGGLAELQTSDDAHLTARSRVGFSALEPNLMELVVGADTDVAEPTSINLTIEERYNQPISGTSKWRLRNWTTGSFEQVGTLTLTNVDTAHALANVDATDRVRDSDGRIELSVKHVVIATFSAIGFDSFFDRVEIAVE